MTNSRSFLTLPDLSVPEFHELLNDAAAIKEGGQSSGVLDRKTLVLLFEKPSTRTRVSFEVGIQELDGTPVTLNADEIQLSRGEPVRDTARVLSRYADGLIARVYNHSALEECVRFGSVPVVNALSDRAHPCQVLSDFLTIRECASTVKVDLAYIGDGNNVCHSLIAGTVLSGATLRLAVPESYGPLPDVLEAARERAADTGAEIRTCDTPDEAAAGADVLYTDVWTSMGHEREVEERREAFKTYRINNALLARAEADAVVMHCLPAHRGEEITEDVLEGDQSVVWQQAENRLHAQKALLRFLFS